MLVVDSHQSRASVPLTVRYTNRADDRVAWTANPGAVADLVTVRAFEDNEALLLTGMEMGSHHIRAGLRQQLCLEQLAVRAFGRGADDEPLAGLRAVDLSAECDQIYDRRKAERIIALPMTNG